MARVIQSFRGKAPKDGTSWLTLSNMKTFMTPDDPHRSAARTCRTHNSMFIVCLSRFRVGARRPVSPRVIHFLSPDLEISARLLPEPLIRKTDGLCRTLLGVDQALGRACSDRYSWS